MPTAYTSGLTITADTVVSRERLLPIAGEVLVSRGQQVEAETPVARAMRPGNLTTVKVSERLGVDPGDVPGTMAKRQGEPVEASEVIAQTRTLFGLFHNQCEAPVGGIIEHISPLSGYVGIREAPAPLEVVAHIAGRIERVIEGQGAVVASRAALVQGIFGVGGERRGALRLATRAPDAPLDLSVAGDGARGAVLVGGATADRKSLADAARAGAAGVVVGSIDDLDLRAFVGYDIGVAVTGQERVPFTLIVTEGFGGVAMARATFELLASLAGKQASIDGTTQIRAGVIRPEIVVALREEAAATAPPLGCDADLQSANFTRLRRAGMAGCNPAPPGDPEPFDFAQGKLREGAGSGAQSQLAVGAQVRLIREPYFGRLAVVTALPPQPQQVETEAKVRVVEVDLGDGRRALVPRANVEMVHG